MIKVASENKFFITGKTANKKKKQIRRVQKS